MRRYELVRLSRWRLCHDVPIDEIGFAKVLADTLAFVPKGQGGLDFWTFDALARDCGIAVAEDVAMAAIHRVAALIKVKGKTYRPLCGLATARLLDVTAEERWQCAIRTMKAVDERPDEAIARRKEERRDYERERSRRRRRDAGVTARGDSLSRAKPWEAEGTSRATWYRHRKNRTEATETGPKPTQARRETISTAHNTRAHLSMRPVVFVPISQAAIQLAQLRQSRWLTSPAEQPSRQASAPHGLSVAGGAVLTSASPQPHQPGAADIRADTGPPTTSSCPLSPGFCERSITPWDGVRDVAEYGGAVRL